MLAGLTQEQTGGEARESRPGLLVKQDPGCVEQRHEQRPQRRIGEQSVIDVGRSKRLVPPLGAQAEDLRDHFADVPGRTRVTRSSERFPRLRSSSAE